MNSWAPLDEIRSQSYGWTGKFQMKLRVLIVDDELLGRERLSDLLRAEPAIEVVGECEDGTEAVNAILEKSPDLVFLDVKMPEMDGFDVLKALSGSRLPAIVFVTAHNDFALRAFDIHAVDYLLKPFDRTRFRSALQRVRQRLGQDRSSKAGQPLPFKSGSDALENIVIRSQGRLSIVKCTDIDWIGAEDNYAELRVGNKTHLLRTTISALALQLTEPQFARISRSVLVNVARIKEIVAKTHGDYTVILKDGTRLPGSRKYRHKFTELLGSR